MSHGASMHQRLKSTHARDVAARLDALRALKDGWMEGKGKALSADGLIWLSGASQRWLAAEFSIPYLYPTAEGGVQAEWSLPPFEVSLEIDLGRRRGYWHRLNVQTGADDEREVDLSSDDDW